MFVRLVCILWVALTPLLAQEWAPGPVLSCPGHSHTEYISQEFRQFRISAQPSSKFIPTYHQVPDSVQEVVEAAFQVWNKILISPVPIRVDVHWQQMSAGTLASAGSDRVFKNFSNAPFRDVWYPSALADALSGSSVNQDRTDIVLRINSQAQWNLQYMEPPSFVFYDMLSVIIHEIAHGIGFMSSFEISSGNRVKWGIQNLPLIYDRYIVDEQDVELINNRFYTNESEEITKAVTENPVYFKIDTGSYSNQKPRLHTESPFSAGASLSHLSSQQNLPAHDRLMLPSLSRGARYHFPGERVLAILFQIGWALNFYEIERDYPYASTSFSVYPNPAEQSISLKLYDLKPDQAPRYQLLDMKGRTIEDIPISSLETEISLSGLQSGRYFLRVGSRTLPFVKL